MSAAGIVSAASPGTTVTIPETGVYCITLSSGLTPPTGVLVVTADYRNDTTLAAPNDPQAFVEYDSSNTDCGANQFAVATGERTVTVSGGVVTNVTNVAIDEG